MATHRESQSSTTTARATMGSFEILPRGPIGFGSKSQRRGRGTGKEVAATLRVAGNEKRKEWSGPGSNRRHLDFQSSALPTELPNPTTGGRYGPSPNSSS
jgi:hypothetical protein